MVVTFFGHRNTPMDIYPKLLETLTELIENKGAKIFFVGNQGNFDYLVRRTLRILAKEYQDITYTVVLSYLPTEKNENFEDYSDTIFPEVLEGVHPAYAIEKRNRWMVDNADVVVSYVKNSYGGARKFCNLAKRKGKTVINLAM